ncbi:hypothetical protein GW17_00035960 [Ensete ventricosum]|nr:hypothetical protein GW17_00035960 [Ensete ventricosum]
MNSYNHGCIHNVKEVLFSSVPKSMNNFRAKVKEDSAGFTSSHSLGRVVSPDTLKTSFDLESGGKRHTVAAEELEDIQSQFEIGASGRCDTQPPHSSWPRDKGNWEITHDMEALAAEFGMEHGYGDRRNTRGIS